MSDSIDRAQEREAEFTAAALSVRKPVSTRCERCNAEAMILPNGARCRYCEPCAKVSQAIRCEACEE